MPESVNDETEEKYFNVEELESAKKYIRVFHGKMLVNPELSTSDQILIGLYMLSNNLRLSDLQKPEAETFFRTRFALSSQQLEENISYLRANNLVEEGQLTIALTFTGLSRIRTMLQSNNTEIPKISLPTSSETGEDLPSIADSGSTTDNILTVLSSPFARKHPLSIDQIRRSLENSAIYTSKGSIAGTLNYLTSTGRLGRRKEKDGFHYYLRKKLS